MLTKKDIRISFHHFDEGGKEGTECFLKLNSKVGLQTMEEEFIGTVRRCYKDKHDKNAARKYALSQAMNHATLTKIERTLVWEIYRDQKPGGRW